MVNNVYDLLKGGDIHVYLINISAAKLTQMQCYLQEEPGSILYVYAVRIHLHYQAHIYSSHNKALVVREVCVCPWCVHIATVQRCDQSTLIVKNRTHM